MLYLHCAMEGIVPFPYSSTSAYFDLSMESAIIYMAIVLILVKI